MKISHALQGSSMPSGPINTMRKIGGSGKPYLHFIQCSNRSDAMNRAREAGKGNTPVLHHEDGRNPHFHPADRNGEIIKDGAHYEFSG